MINNRCLPRVGFAMLLALGLACQGSSRHPSSVFRPPLNLRSECNSLLTRDLVAQYYAHGDKLLAAVTDGQRRRILRMLTITFRHRLRLHARAGLHFKLDYAYPRIDAGPNDLAYRHLTLISTMPHLTAVDWSTVPSVFTDVWISQYSYPPEANYPTDKPLLLQCWAAQSLQEGARKPAPQGRN
jgi:hypothetical protein